MLRMIIHDKIFTGRMHISKSDNYRHAFPVGFRNTASPLGVTLRNVVFIASSSCYG